MLRNPVKLKNKEPQNLYNKKKKNIKKREAKRTTALLISKEKINNHTNNKNKHKSPTKALQNEYI